ncbi:MAG: putative toxin-antitoxin system toxin component, PIN family [Oscillospiraceae bacterium]|nr:putative toxin-antitoxin system toxin component, PIN family [Oscillospiraceae bacterium]
MAKYYAVIDTNVLVSAMLKWNSVPGTILALTFDGAIVPLMNAEIFQEYHDVLLRPKFKLTDEIVNDLLESLKSAGIFIDAEPLTIDLPDPKDLVFYEVVMEGRKETDAYLVTGNIRHFPVKPFVVTPRQMLDIILSSKDDATL